MRLARPVAGILLALSAVSSPALAGSVSTPECQRDLLVANSRVEQSHQKVVSLAEATQKELCPAWKGYAEQARSAASIYKRCLTGTDQRVRVAEMNAAATDFEDAYKSRCK